MSGRPVWTVVAGFLGAALVFGVLAVLVDVGRLVAVLRSASPPLVGAVALLGVGWLFAWGLELRTVLGTLGVDLSIRESFLVYASAAFANAVTPFGQAGGEPVTALLVSRVTPARYETGLAAIASVDTLNVVPSVVLALFGLGWFATSVTLGGSLAVAAAVAAALAVLLPLAFWLAWRHRARIEARGAAVLGPPIRWLAAVLPGVSVPSLVAIEGRITSFVESVERVAADRRRLALAAAFSAAGWLCQILALAVAFHAVGAPVPVVVLLFVVPLANVAGFAPLPGGLGGIEAAFVTLLVAAGVADPAVATAAVVVHRGAVYWLPILLGGGVVAAYGVEIYG
jgi:uncharacterized protein (TIRG00374 family)